MQGGWDGCWQPSLPTSVRKHLCCRRRLQHPPRPPAAILGGPGTVLPSGTSRREPGLQKAKTGLKMVRSKKKGKKRSFGTFLISPPAPEPPGYARFTFARLFSVSWKTRNARLANEGRAPQALVWVGNLAGLSGLQPLQFLKPLSPQVPLTQPGRGKWHESGSKGSMACRGIRPPR